ncbi:hypothetical protein C2G38_2167554 [Gigaspora rosea]|uniref:Uncharacterized protein n=1 Tax=Gigaspora rosea TaxID=44941 RepID=A0A397VS80_9GLOM|nr:hypothetical protein C2G38_2167554 [Gigaspora rosea]
MANVIDLKKELYNALQDSSEIVSYNAKLQDKYEKQEKDFNQERNKWDRNRKKWSKKLEGDKYEKQEKDFNQERNKWDRDRKKWSKKLEGVASENQNLQFENASKAISFANSKSENITKSKRIRLLKSMIKILESKSSSVQIDVFSIQKNSSNKESGVLSFKSKITELEHELALNISKLECLKSKNMPVSIVGGNNKKNITKSRPEGWKINGNISTYTNNEITELPKNDTEINPKVSDEIDISKTNKDNMLDTLIKPNIIEAMSQNITPHLAQRENISSLIELNSQMRPSLEASLFPIEAIPMVSSTLISPLSAYIFLTLLIIAIMWFIILRSSWNMGRLEEPLLCNKKSDWL